MLCVVLVLCLSVPKQCVNSTVRGFYRSEEPLGWRAPKLSPYGPTWSLAVSVSGLRWHIFICVFFLGGGGW